MREKGFTLIREQQVDELSSTARLWRHEATGAELLSFINNDENKVFGVSFRTPPADSTGVAHILEHSVLCGSEKYPVKEPFVELLKGSLQTFLNAFTYPDKTCYPVASANLADFYNLTDVYLDAVFYPRISEAIFQQEGWHLEPQEDNGDLIFKGVVYNEMKGAFSSPESVLGRHSLHSLFPDTVYRLESGGDPEDIPSLTYEDFHRFHRQYYHPSNARFFFWGDDPENERLTRLGAVLDRFSRLEIDSSIGMQSPLPEPRLVRVPYAASETDAADGKGMVTVNWLGPDVMDVELSLAFRMLEYMLLGMPASPLRRTLLESGLGEDLAGQGLETELRQLVFDVGLKGVDVARADEVQQCILQTIERLAREGVPQDLVDAAINTVEFNLRENNSGRFPVGLSVMLRALTTWLHGGDPLSPLAFEGPLAAIKDRAASGGYFEGLLNRWFLENTHRVTMVLFPDHQLARKREEQERLKLAELAGNMDAEERRRILAGAVSLAEWQATPDTAEALATIPRLSVAHLPRQNVPIPTEVSGNEYEPVYFHGLPTGGIVYAEAGFSLDGLPQDLVPLLPLFGRALVELGTTDRDFVALNMAISQKTGGLDAGNLFLSRLDTGETVSRLLLYGKSTPDKAEDLFGLIREVLLKAVFDDQNRFRQMILEDKARMEQELVPAGHSMAASRLRAAYSQTALLGELTGGVSHLEYLRALAERDWPSILSDLETLRSTVLAKARLEWNLTALPEQADTVRNLARQVSSALPDGSAGKPAWKRLAFPPAEALILPAQVNYIGKACNLYESGFSWHGSVPVILKFLRTGYLWDKIRVQGGAYGCMCGMDRVSGAFHIVSYRDPNVRQTLDVYDALGDWLLSHDLTREELDAAIVGAIGDLDTYMLPDAKGSAAYTRILAQETPERRQELRDQILGTGKQDFRRFGEALSHFKDKGRICAMGGSNLEQVGRDAGWIVSKVL